MPARTPELSVVVVVHETPAEARSLVESVVRHTAVDHELIVVDNGSSTSAADSLAKLAAEAGAELIRFEDNRSFARATNAGVAAGTAPDVALLNSDCGATDGWWPNLRAALHSSPDVAAAGPRSNCARGAQGGVFLDDLTPAGIERFARSFNYPDPARWFDVDWLSGFAVAIRREPFTQVGGFDERIATGDGEDRDLSERLLAAGYRLLCAGDTFVFHLGHRTYFSAGLNRTAMRLRRGEARAASDDRTDARLLRDDQGRVFEVCDGVACHIETGAALRLMRGGRSIDPSPAGYLEALPVGPPIGLVRSAESADVWLMHQGRRKVEGDPQRIRRLPGLSVVETGALETLPQGAPVSVDEALPPVPDMAPVLPANPAVIDPERLTGAEVIASEIAAALDEARGYALIRLGSGEALLMNDGMWPVTGFNLNYAGVRGDHPAAARALREAIMGADAVGVQTRRDQFYCAPLLEQLLFHFDLYPRVRCDAHVNFALLGLDPETGDEVGEPHLRRLLAGRRVAVVGRLADEARRNADGIGLDIRVAEKLDDMREIDEVFRRLASQQDKYDVALVAASIPAKPLCVRLARELDVVALDIGHVLDRLLHRRYNLTTFALVKTRWEAGEYLRMLGEPPPAPAHEFEGRLIRETGGRAVYYVERGTARWISHKAFFALFDHKPIEVEPAVLAALPRGVPLCAVQERLTGPYVLLDGHKVPLRLGMQVVELDDLALDDVPEADYSIDWFPGA